MVGVVGSSPIVPTRQMKKGSRKRPFFCLGVSAFTPLPWPSPARGEGPGARESPPQPSVVRRFNGAMPSALTNPDGAAGLRLAGGLAGFFAAVFVAPLPSLSVFFFLVPAALPDALTFFGPW